MPNNSSRNIPLQAAIILLPAAGCFAAMADLPHVLILTVLLLGFSALRRTGWPFSDRGIIYTVVAALILTAFGNYLVPLRTERYGFMALFSRPALTVPFALYLGALAPGFRRRPLAVGTAAAAALFAFTIGADVRFESLAPERMRPLLPFPVDFPMWYAITAGISCLATLASSRAWPMGGKSLHHTRWRHRFWLVLAAGAILLLTFGEYRFYRQYESTFRSWENMLLRIGIRQLYPGSNSSRIRFGGTPDLNAGFPPEQRETAQQVLLRAVGPQPPGYLRMNAYTQYEYGRWGVSAAAERKDNLEATANPEGTYYADQLYRITRPEPTASSWMFYPDSQFRSDTLPIPGNTVSLRFIADQATIGRDGLLELTGLAREGGYTVYVDQPGMAEAYPLPSLPDAEFTAVPPVLRPTLRALADELELDRQPDDATRFAKAIDFFNRNFEYALDWPGAKWDDDPVRLFLTEHRRAHCELFAAALALLLRESGVPTRYVTGLVCAEPHPSKRYYLARVANSHAWVEAFDRDRKRWVLLDATPAQVNIAPPPPPDNWKNRFGSTFDALALLWAQVIAAMRSGRVANAIMMLPTLLGGLFRLLFWNPIGGPALLIGLFLSGRAWQRRRLLRRRHASLSDAMRKRQAEYLQLCRQLQHEKFLGPGAEPTAVELLAQLRADTALPEERRRRLIEFLELYLVCRYRPTESD